MDIPNGLNSARSSRKDTHRLPKGFIRAETIQWDQLLETGGWAQAKEEGKIRVEGKDYIVQDGDVMEFRFNV